MDSRKVAAKTAIALGQADVLAGRVTPHETVARAVGVRPAKPVGRIAERAVVWSDAARMTFIAAIEGLLGRDSTKARALAAAVERVAEQLGHAPRAVSGRVAFTWEKAVPETTYLLVFELVTWTKAGDVVAIDALIDEANDPSMEAPIWLHTE